jgi:hypothetical protein
MTTSQVLPRLKVALLRGQKISTLDGLKRFGTMRLSEYIRRLRNDKVNPMDIDCVMKTDKRTKKTYGVYSYGDKR